MKNTIVVNRKITTSYAPNNILRVNSCPQRDRAGDKLDLVPFEIYVLDQKSHLPSLVTLYNSHFSSSMLSPSFAAVGAPPYITIIAMGCHWRMKMKWGFLFERKMTDNSRVKKKLGFFCLLGNGVGLALLFLVQLTFLYCYLSLLFLLFIINHSRLLCGWYTYIHVWKFSVGWWLITNGKFFLTNTRKLIFYCFIINHLSY